MQRGIGQAELRATHHVQDLPTKAAIAQQRGYIGVAGEAPEAIILPEECGCRFADRRVGG